MPILLMMNWRHRGAESLDHGPVPNDCWAQHWSQALAQVTMLLLCTLVCLI